MKKYPKQALIYRPVALQAKARFPVDTRGGGRRLILDLPEALLDEMSQCPGVESKLTAICIDILESMCHRLDVTRVREQPEQLIRKRLTRRDSKAKQIRADRNVSRRLTGRLHALYLDRSDYMLQHCDRPAVLQRCADELHALTRSILYDVAPSEDVCDGLTRNGWDRGRVLLLVEELQVLHWLTLAEETEDELEQTNGFRYRMRRAAGATQMTWSLVQPSAIIPGNQCIFCRGRLANHRSIKDRAGKRCLNRWIEAYAISLIATSHDPALSIFSKRSGTGGRATSRKSTTTATALTPLSYTLNALSDCSR